MAQQAFAETDQVYQKGLSMKFMDLIRCLGWLHAPGNFDVGIIHVPGKSFGIEAGEIANVSVK